MRIILLIATFLFLSSLMGIFPYVNLIINLNTGLPLIRGINTVTIYIPVAIILLYTLVTKNLELPHLYLFLITVLLFVLIEFFHSTKFQGLFEMDLMLKVMTVYLNYVVLICLLKVFGLQLILRWGIFFGLAFTVLIILSYTELFVGHHQNFDLFESESFERAGKKGSSMNVNILSYKAVITFILMIAYREKFGLKPKYQWLMLLFSLMILGEVVLHASRGAFLCYTLIAAIVFIKNSNYTYWLFGGIGLVGVFILYSDAIIGYFSSFQIAERLGQDVNEVSRVVQFNANWQNFIKKPFFGVGYVNAALGYSKNVVRSNVTWTQVLASHGIFYTIFYVYFIFKLFIMKTSSLKYMLPLCIMIFILINLSSQRPFGYLALLALIGYSEFHLENARNEEDSLS